MRQLILIFLLTFTLSAKSISPNEVYAQAMLISDQTHYLLDYYNVKHDHEGIIARTAVNTKLKQRNVWQMTYEIAIKINILRSYHDLPIVKPVNIAPELNLNPALVYEQTQRILTEIKIFQYRMGIKNKEFKVKKYTQKTPLDVFNLLRKISASLDELYQTKFTPSYVFGETMRVYDDLTTILEHLKIKDNTIPTSKNDKATPKDTFNISMRILQKIKKVQFSMGIESVDFSVFRKEDITPSDVLL